MKKILAALLCLALLLCTAFAEEMVYDPAVLTELGGEIVTVQMEDFGMQFDLSADMNQIEVTEEMFFEGVMSAFENEDKSLSLSVNFMQQTDEAGAGVADYDALAAYYTANGVTSTEMVMVNGMEAMRFEIESTGSTGLAFLYEEGWALSFTFTGVTDEATALYASAVLDSIRPIEDVEIVEDMEINGEIEAEAAAE